MNFAMKSRLSLMMFLQYFIWGAWYVTFGTWLATALHFSGQQIAWAAGTTAIGAILSPFFIGLIADKYFSSQHVLGALHAIGAVLLWQTTQQATFVTVFATLLLYSICFMPTLALTNSLAFRQMQDTQRQFAQIRAFGTIGWIVAGLIVGLLGIETVATPLKLAAGASLLMALYCLTLPPTPPLAKGVQVKAGQIVPKEALLLLFRKRSVAVFAIASFLICIPLQFYYAFTNLFLNETGVQGAAARMAGGQMSELFCLLLIPLFFRRLGVKYMLTVGMLAWAVRYLMFAFGNPAELNWMLWAGILLHGICYDFFFVVGQIYIDREAPNSLRAAAQGMITLITYGAGMLAGSWASGKVVDAYRLTDTSHDWQSIWMFPAIFSALVLAFFLFTFSENKRTAQVAASEA